MEVIKKMVSPIVDKFILTVSNLAVLIPIYYSIIPIDIVLLGTAAFFSILHHSDEVRFYGPAIINLSPDIQWLILQLDRCVAALAMIVVGRVNLLKDQFLLASIVFSCMLASDLVMYTPEWILSRGVQRIVRVTLHTFWHIMALGYFGNLAVTLYSNDERICLYLWEYIKTSMSTTSTSTSFSENRSLEL